MKTIQKSAARDLTYALHAQMYTERNDVRFLVGGGEAFAAMLADIVAAQRTVHLETYILHSDDVGWRFAEAMIARAEAGVEVRLLYDAIGGLDVSGDYLAALRAAGVQVAIYGPLVPWKPRFRLHARNHRKILVCDNRVGFTGGLNIGNEYDSVDNGGGGWHDLHARVEGPAVAELTRLFRRDWIRAGGTPFPQPGASPPSPNGAALALTVGNSELSRRRAIRREYLFAFKRARKSIHITNAYFIPDRGIRRVLFNAVRRGVNVSVIVPADSDVKAVQWASQYTYTALLKGGVRLYEWQWHMLHAKTAVVDDVWSTIGSYNLDARSLFHNLEVVVCVIDRAFGEKHRAQHVADLALSREIVLSEWHKRPFWRKWWEWFFYQFRFWL